jgi:hypothetical protein
MIDLYLLTADVLALVCGVDSRCYRWAVARAAECEVFQ